MVGDTVCFSTSSFLLLVVFSLLLVAMPLLLVASGLWTSPSTAGIGQDFAMGHIKSWWNLRKFVLKLSQQTLPPASWAKETRR